MADSTSGGSCPYCYGPLNTAGQCNDPVCRANRPVVIPSCWPTGNYGWICPVCGRGNAPGTATCPCIPIPVTITFGG